MHRAGNESSAHVGGPPAAVIFDVDGVLVDSARPHFESWRRLGEEHGVHVAETEFHATFGRHNRDIIPILFGSVPSPQLEQLADRKEQIYRDLVRSDPPIVPGAVSLVRSLHAAGIALAVGSSAPRANLDLVLGAMGVATHFPVVVSADDVTRGKPDPEVFQLAIERLKARPNRTIVIEDAPVGVEAARRAGARTVAVLMHHPREAFAGADLIVPRLADLTVEVLHQLLAR